MDFWSDFWLGFWPEFWPDLWPDFWQGFWLGSSGPENTVLQLHWDRKYCVQFYRGREKLFTIHDSNSSKSKTLC